MFVLVSRYLLPADEVAVLTPRHSEWIAEAYAAGRVLVSGRQNPPEGGVIVAAGHDLADITTWIATDPFVVGGAAEYAVTEFGATPFPKRSTAFNSFAATVIADPTAATSIGA